MKADEPKLLPSKLLTFEFDVGIVEKEIAAVLVGGGGMKDGKLDVELVKVDRPGACGVDGDACERGGVAMPMPV